MQQRWQEVQDLYLAASSLADPQRDAFVNCIAPGLRDEVRALLEPRFADGAPSGRPLRGIEGRVVGSCCGAYRLLKWLDANGSPLERGRETYLAVRMDLPPAERVPVKLVRCASDDPAVVARFCASRQLLAQLDHPCIARVIDGGNWRGTPYFVMESPEGLPITTYCHQQRIPTDERRTLIARVRSALAHAHAHTFVHGDVRAETIRITEDGTPKIEFLQSNGTPFADFSALSAVMRELGVDPVKPWLLEKLAANALLPARVHAEATT